MTNPKQPGQLARDLAAIDADPLATTTDPTPKRTTDKYAKAGQLARRLAALDAEESAEIQASPSSIRSKFEKKRAGVLEGQPAEVVELVDAMRGAGKSE
jgi:hypothetical protein